jgi:hypothetical protein
MCGAPGWWLLACLVWPWHRTTEANVYSLFSNQPDYLKKKLFSVITTSKTFAPASAYNTQFL